MLKLGKKAPGPHGNLQGEQDGRGNALHDLDGPHISLGIDSEESLDRLRHLHVRRKGGKLHTLL